MVERSKLKEQLLELKQKKILGSLKTKEVKEAYKSKIKEEKIDRDIKRKEEELSIRRRLGEMLDKSLSKKVVSKKVYKGQQMSATIPNFKAPSILGDENRFFKQEMEETKKSLFFS